LIAEWAKAHCNQISRLKPAKKRTKGTLPPPPEGGGKQLLKSWLKPANIADP
jgi:hypothetical protein